MMAHCLHYTVRGITKMTMDELPCHGSFVEWYIDGSIHGYRNYVWFWWWLFVNSSAFQLGRSLEAVDHYVLHLFQLWFSFQNILWNTAIEVIMLWCFCIECNVGVLFDLFYVLDLWYIVCRPKLNNYVFLCFYYN